MFITWLYDLKGSRRRLYQGHSYNNAEAALNIAQTVVETFELDCTLLIMKGRNLLDGDVQFRLDFKNGEHRRDIDNNLRLALD